MCPVTRSRDLSVRGETKIDERPLIPGLRFKRVRSSVDCFTIAKIKGFHFITYGSRVSNVERVAGQVAVGQFDWIMGDETSN